ncbi:hypothetical protein J6590_075004 [Homalodisca vitripennis]|nr:hypothetical protein J6590_075004 [Homalodisca vitripennis]
MSDSSHTDQADIPPSIEVDNFTLSTELVLRSPIAFSKQVVSNGIRHIRVYMKVGSVVHGKWDLCRRVVFSKQVVSTLLCNRKKGKPALYQSVRLKQAENSTPIRPIDIPLHTNISNFAVSDVPPLDIHKGLGDRLWSPTVRCGYRNVNDTMFDLAQLQISACVTRRFFRQAINKTTSAVSQCLSQPTNTDLVSYVFHVQIRLLVSRGDLLDKQ